MGANCPPLVIQTEGGPQKMNCANTEGIFRIIQSIPSSKAEPFKRWLAKVDDAKGFPENKRATGKGGGVAGKACKDFERKTGKRVVSSENYLTETENHKRIKRKKQ